MGRRFNMPGERSSRHAPLIKTDCFSMATPANAPIEKAQHQPSLDPSLPLPLFPVVLLHYLCI
jgi:hypothetical protein